MALTLEDLLDRITVRPPVAVKVPVLGDVWMRHPTVEEWHEITSAHQKLDGGAAPLTLICRTIAMAVCDENGKQIMSAGDARKLSDRDAAAVMGLYTKVVETVFPIDEERIGEAEKN